MLSYSTTRHAEQRIGQRSRHSDVELACTYADRTIPSFDGREVVSFSHNMLSRLLKEGQITAQQAERLKRLNIVFASDGTIVTVVNTTSIRQRYCH
jgi:hypothetical protein